MAVLFLFRNGVAYLGDEFVGVLSLVGADVVDVEHGAGIAVAVGLDPRASVTRSSVVIGFLPSVCFINNTISSLKAECETHAVQICNIAAVCAALLSDKAEAACACKVL